MTSSEFATLAAALKTAYMRDKFLATKEAYDLWFGMLGDLPYEAASNAVKRWILTEKWTPTIADIRERATQVMMPAIPDWSEGWEAVMNAIHRWGMHRESEALATLPEIARKTVKRIGWQNICLSEEIGVERANFRQIYDAIAERERKTAQLPPGLTASITQRQEIQGGQYDRLEDQRNLQG